ncbi:MAG: phosphoribosyltransferase [Thermoproteota archaeon]|nr:phosphoribosyltransferase [Thermoproteota archaeon]
MLFVNRTDAARQLAEKLIWLKDTAQELRKYYYNNDDDNPLVILAIPRGGVVIGDIISDRLGAKLDLVVPRKIGAPFNPELAIGAVMPDGTCFLNASRVEALQVPQQYIAAQTVAQMKEIDRRLVSYRGRRGYDKELEDKIVILVDDGIATGSTIYAAAQWVKAQKCSQLVIAVPVGPRETIERLREVADMVVAIDAPTLFQAVGEFYQDFSQVEDDEVKTMMRRHGYKPADYRETLAE